LVAAEGRSKISVVKASFTWFAPPGQWRGKRRKMARSQVV
jgi:hypothetical protein